MQRSQSHRSPAQQADGHNRVQDKHLPQIALNPGPAEISPWCTRYALRHARDSSPPRLHIRYASIIRGQRIAFITPAGDAKHQPCHIARPGEGGRSNVGMQGRKRAPGNGK